MTPVRKHVRRATSQEAFGDVTAATRSMNCASVKGLTAHYYPATDCGVLMAGDGTQHRGNVPQTCT